jgi:hypothetical protein
MPRELPRDSRALLADQGGVIASWQAERVGLTGATLKNRVRYGTWQRLHHGVYASFTGTPTREAQLWAALLRAGPDAILSHYTAAERHGLISRPSAAIHVTVPSGHNPARRTKIPSLVVHRSNSILAGRHPMMAPPCTRIDETVLDLVEIAGTFDEAYDWICRAIGRRRTTAARLRQALDARPRFRWRTTIELALNEASDGTLSWLERRYVRAVERPHGLPSGIRQARVRLATGSRYLDNLYELYRLCVELDGSAAHPADEQWLDKRRDRRNLAERNIVTMRFGFVDLHDQDHQCATAAEVAKALSDRGPSVGLPCNPACPIPNATGLPRVITRQ